MTNQTIVRRPRTSMLSEHFQLYGFKQRVIEPLKFKPPDTTYLEFHDHLLSEVAKQFGVSTAPSGQHKPCINKPQPNGWWAKLCRKLVCKT